MTFWRGMVLVVAMALACTAASAQQAGRRVALVIGNSAYAAQGTLANPGPDSRLVADALRRVGFSVTAQTDLGKQGMERSLRDFAAAADGAEVALIYFAGHGMEANGVNWLLPVDAVLAEERNLRFEAIDLDTALAAVEGARGLRMVVLDACRNNPFTRSMRRSASATRAVTRGLADVEVTGTLVLYSARGGSLAQDGTAGGNSPFAAALARRIPEPGVDIRLLVSKVRDDVLAATGRAQEPFSYGSLPGVGMFLVNGTATPVPPVPAIPSPGADDPETLIWQSVLQQNTADAYRAYLSAYGNGKYAGIARRNMNALPASAPVAATPAPESATTAESMFAQALGSWSLGSCAASIRARILGYPTSMILQWEGVNQPSEIYSVDSALTNGKMVARRVRGAATMNLFMRVDGNTLYLQRATDRREQAFVKC